EFEDFVAKGDTARDEPSSPAAPVRRQAASTASAVGSDAPTWMQRAATAKKTEAQPFRYNRDQQRLLEHAKQVEGRDYSKILADIVWPALEAKYGGEVPFGED